MICIYNLLNSWLILPPRHCTTALLEFASVEHALSPLKAGTPYHSKLCPKKVVEENGFPKVHLHVPC